MTSTASPSRALMTMSLCGALLVGACQQDRLIGEELASTEGGGGMGGKGPVPQTATGISSVSTSAGGGGPVGCTGASPGAREALATVAGKTTVAAGGPAPDPDTLSFVFGDQTLTCADPSLQVPCGGHWGMRVILPPALQHLGKFDFADTDPNTVFFESGPEPKDCAGGGGSLITGSIEIVCLAEAGAIFRVEGASVLALAGVDPNGEYVAFRCP